jgi:hypothetical protein
MDLITCNCAGYYFLDPVNNKPSEIKMVNGKPPIIVCKSINIEKKSIVKPRVI